MFSIYDARYFDKVALSTPGYREITDRLVRKIDAKPYHAVLDIGAGTGRIALKLAGSVSRVVAVDSSEAMVAKIAEKIRKKHIPNIRVVESDITRWDFLWPNSDPILTGAAFNTIICSFVLHHLTDKWKKIVLGRLRESLTVDGQLIIADVQSASAWRIRRQAAAFYWKLVREKGHTYPAWSMMKNIASWLFFERSLPAGRWETLLVEAGYRTITNETTGDFTLIAAHA